MAMIALQINIKFEIYDRNVDLIAARWSLKSAKSIAKHYSKQCLERISRLLSAI